jgi:hypothetical protein
VLTDVHSSAAIWQNRLLAQDQLDPNLGSHVDVLVNGELAGGRASLLITSPSNPLAPQRSRGGQ